MRREPFKQATLPVPRQRKAAPAAKRSHGAMAPPILTEANSGKPPRPCDGVQRHVSNFEVQKQEARQGWSHMPCGIHAAPYRVDLVAKAHQPLKMSACAFSKAPALPLVETLVRMSIEEGLL